MSNLDATKNFCLVTVQGTYSSTDTSVTLSAGQGALLPAPPFNMTWFNATSYPNPALDPNVEIVRVTAIATDTLTVIRGQEQTVASNKNTAGVTYQMINAITTKMIEDIGNNLLIQLAVQSGTVDGSNTQFGFTKEPTFIIADGALHAVGDGWSWNGTSLIATLIVAPQSSLIALVYGA